MKKKIMVLFGTRPEAIKLAPVINELKKEKIFKTLVCSTGQHREMLKQVLDLFKIKLDADLDLMKPNQDLFDITVNATSKLKETLKKYNPDCLIVQGDTSTAFIAALSSFYLKIPVAHVEAGLRSYNIYSPFPEEANRRFVSIISSFHFAPTKDSMNNILSEGVNKKKIWITGNTVVDALLDVKSLLQKESIEIKIKQKLSNDILRICENNKYILLTMHRREKFGNEFRSVLKTIKKLAESYPDYYFLYPVHLNPNVSKPVNELLSTAPNIKLLPPLDYLTFIYLMSKCYFIMSDSGGVQEECYVFKKSVMVLRDVTERNEAIKAGYAFLVGSNDKLITKTFNIIDKKLKEKYNFFKTKNPYGDGNSAKRIVRILKKSLV